MKEKRGMIDRRSFVKISAGIAAGSMFGLDGTARVLKAMTAAGRSIENIGVQLYTVRDLMENDVRGTLEAVARAGYKEVEFHDYFGHSPEEVRAMLDDLGLVTPAIHVSLEKVRSDLAALIDQAHTVGHTYLISPWLAEEERGSIDSYRRLAASFNDFGQLCRNEGLRFGWHNHAFEFEKIDGTVPLDVLLEETDPELVAFELDLFWTIAGGADPIDYFERFPGRFPLCHVKDMTADGSMVDVGAGEIDFAAIFRHADAAGLVHYVVEHDDPANPIASITASYEYLAALEL
jgi:sugar phosphate isomerase/epimerase